ncbi:MAG: DUF4476 domain-containing protein [Bacteroidia bacterium]|nr:DUF4476 domain-containing protein [Bacteroidia bacterium]MDW8088644.1 DUF4476 domain-containing protein [Bacteroidia bacterium]
MWRWIGLMGLGLMWGQKCVMATLSEVDFNYFRLEVAAQSLESNRIALLRTLLSEHCISAAQLRELLWLLEYENSRLEMLSFAAERIYNPHQLRSELEPLFSTPSARREFEKWWEKWEKAHPRPSPKKH